MKTLIMLLGAVLLGVASPALAQSPPQGANAPVTMRIECYVGSAPAGTALVTSWRVSAASGVYDLRVTKLRTLTGPLAPFTVVKRLEPYPVAFSIAGDPRWINAFISAPPGHPLAITGTLVLQHASRVLTISKVESNAPLTPAPAIDEHFGEPPPPDGSFGVPRPAE
jgi:hypothetical protein